MEGGGGRSLKLRAWVIGYIYLKRSLCGKELNYPSVLMINQSV